MKKALVLLGLVCSMSCDDIVEVQDISNKTVVALAPTNEAILSTTTLSFSWEAVEDAEHYHIQIAMPTFEEALQIVKDSTLTGTSFNTMLDSNNYEWRIRAENSAYQTEYTTQSFSIEE